LPHASRLTWRVRVSPPGKNEQTFQHRRNVRWRLGGGRFVPPGWKPGLYGRQDARRHGRDMICGDDLPHPGPLPKERENRSPRFWNVV